MRLAFFNFSFICVFCLSITESRYTGGRELYKYGTEELKKTDQCKKCSALGKCASLFNTQGHCDSDQDNLFHVAEDCKGYGKCKESIMPNCDCKDEEGKAIRGCEIPQKVDGRLLPKLCPTRYPQTEVIDDDNPDYFIDLVVCIEADRNCNLCQPGRYCKTEDGDLLCIHPKYEKDWECKCINWKINDCKVMEAPTVSPVSSTFSIPSQTPSPVKSPTVASRTADLSDFGYTYAWPSEEGWFVAPVYGERSFYSEKNIASLEECASFCSNEKDTAGGSYSPKNKRCYCNKSLECLEPEIIDRGGTVFSSSRKPGVCAKSYCDYFPQFVNYCNHPGLQRRTKSPSISPIKSQTKILTDAPITSEPTYSPTYNPTYSPTYDPTSSTPVSSQPTLSPTESPVTFQPTYSPTNMQDTFEPSIPKPLSSPTKILIYSPTIKVSLTSRSTFSPSKIPIDSPTKSQPKSPIIDSSALMTTKSPTTSPITIRPIGFPAVTPKIEDGDEMNARDGERGAVAATTANISQALAIRVQGSLAGWTTLSLISWLAVSM